jgi:hypothetical protein
MKKFISSLFIQRPDFILRAQGSTYIGQKREFFHPKNTAEAPGLMSNDWHAIKQMTYFLRLLAVSMFAVLKHVIFGKIYLNSFSNNQPEKK